MGDYCDGCQYRRHPLFSEDEPSLQISLYYDDLEICNALGSKTKIHKLGMQIVIRCTIYVITYSYVTEFWEMDPNHTFVFVFGYISTYYMDSTMCILQDIS